MATATHLSSESIDFEQDQELSLSDRLKLFKSSQFDPESYLTSKCRGMSEKEIRHCCAYLKDLKKASAEEMRKSVYANYSAFIRTAKEISALEGQLLSMRNLLSAQSKVVHDLSEGVRIKTLYHDAEDSTNQEISDEETRELAKIDNWLADFHETMDVLLAEKRVGEALSALDEAERISEEINDKRVLSPTALISFTACISEQRRRLSDQLKETASQPSTRGGELRSVVLALKKLGDGPTAHALLLNAHHQKIQISIKSLRPNGGSSSSFSSSSSGGGGMSYSTSLSQLVFSTIGQAATDSLAVFGEDTCFTSELVTWAVKETEAFALLIKRHSLASAAIAGSLRSATLTVHVCMGHCSLLEARGFALTSVLLKHFKPCVEQALSANLIRIERTCAALAADDDWSFSFPTTTTSTATSSVSQPKLSSSGHRFNFMILELFEDTETLETMQLVGSTLDGLLRVFQSYVGIMVNALPGSMNDGNQEGSSVIVKQAEGLTQQMSLLANALLLGDELIPRAAAKVLPLASRGDETARRGGGDRGVVSRFPEQREWKRKLQRTVDFLRDSFCRQHALELIFTDDGYIQLNAQMYLCMDDVAQEPDWFPSQIFQDLFWKLTQIASIASDMFVGKERFATVLLMRLTETVILWLSEDQTFWEDIEQGPKALGAFGLQQFYLDMEFVILFASQGRYLSRKLQEVAKNVISRAIEAVAATGIDPYSSLPEDEWFADVAQIAIKTLLGKASFGMEGDGSPTASASARSHGSN